MAPDRNKQGRSSLQIFDQEDSSRGPQPTDKAFATIRRLEIKASPSEKRKHNMTLGFITGHGHRGGSMDTDGV